MNNAATLFDYSAGTTPPVVMAPALLGGSFSSMRASAEACLDGGADALHLDVMDGHFVPEITFGTKMIAELRAELRPEAVLDVHLLCDGVDRMVDGFLAAGADVLSFPLETSDNPYRSLEKIRDHGCRAGVAILPATPISALEELLPLLDLVVVMTVHPGESRLLSTISDKLARLRSMIDRSGHRVRVCADGGVKRNTIGGLATSGVDWMVAASAVFAGGDIAQNIAGLRQDAIAGRQ
jgi:ribulose-phosphate 3-epimerase